MNNKKWKDFKMSREQRKEDLNGFKYSQSDNEFFKEGEYWTISYGGKTIRLKDTVGLQYIVCLLRNPNHKFHVMQLAHKRNKHTQKSIYKNMNLKLLKNELLSISLLDEAEAVLDSQAIGEYKKALNDLNKELEDVREFNNYERVVEIQDKIDSISKEFTKAFIKGGHLRVFDRTNEKARKAVGNAINNSLNKIKIEHQSLWKHFKNSIQLGRFCSYTPERSISWLS